MDCQTALKQCQASKSHTSLYSVAFLIMAITLTVMGFTYFCCWVSNHDWEAVDKHAVKMQTEQMEWELERDRERARQWDEERQRDREQKRERDVERQMDEERVREEEREWDQATGYSEEWRGERSC